MASTRMSPGGALLRASRVFAIPNPLPRPAGTLSSQAVYNSDTATLSHPIHQSITTPPSSLAKGDWGFKRPLPLRATTRTSTPIIRVEAIDTFEHITEFNSAADHTLTLKKWQEMNMPISTPKLGKSVTTASRDKVIPQHRSVFDDDIDTTSNPQDDPALVGQDQEHTRWKFSGPWLAGLTEGEFQTYVAKEVGRRKSEFRQFLKESCALALTSEARAKAQDGGRAMGNVQTISADQISEEQLSTYIRRLRNDITTLYQQIRAFLDLAPSPAPKPADEVGEVYEDLASYTKPAAVEVSTSPYAESGPPKTHPSAGLSYTRSNRWIYNHALYGPQAHPPPVQARIVMPKNASGSMPVLGVGGVVVNTPAGFPAFDLKPAPVQRFRPDVVPGLLYVEPDKYGGSKTYVEPKHAYIDPKGKIVLSVIPADADAVAVKEDKVDEIPERLKRHSMPPASFESSSRQKGSGEGYGLSMDF
ncbi:hypothetical protein DSL72_004861 [Monilinia vaccinii-corymbosi]|uniref:Uncharacterized protein n=1 Tax=Monilinia vaccinii-corymbosi TaxID=61207 RepID=A0A8A3P952_9HELO|nr:hypothetical protein DSL72_004861 [Monilinia vaccinii-corymbosi]